jgi:hypothetical protein
MVTITVPDNPTRDDLERINNDREDHLAVVYHYPCNCSCADDAWVFTLDPKHEHATCSYCSHEH